MRARRREGLLEAFSRVSWGRRIETSLAFAATALRLVLVHLPGSRPSEAILALGAGVLITAPPTRQWLVEALVVNAWSAGSPRPSCAPAWNRPPSWPCGPCPPAPPSPSRSRRGRRPTTTTRPPRPWPCASGPGGCGWSVTRPMPARADLTVVTRDPFAGPGTAWAGTAMPWTDLWSGLPIGVDEDGEAVWLELAGHHVLIGGEPGAGKSNALSMIVAAAALDPFVELWCLDAKLVELAPWRDVSQGFVGPDIAEATAALVVLQKPR